MADEDAAAVPVFKKRVKSAFKRKHESSEDEAESHPHLSVAEILRQRRQGKVRRSAIAIPQERDESFVAPVAGKQETEMDKMNRFVPQTGQVVDVYDKQMNDFIETKMAEYRSQNGNTSITPATNHLSTSTSTADMSATAKVHSTDKHSVTAGRLMEVDVSNSQALWDEEAAAKAAKQPRVRLGRDGKPWRSRKRRNSEKLARDALIDSILKETPLSRFQESAPTPSTNVGKNDYVDEDTVLQNFKNNYQDPEMRTRKPPTKSTAQQDEKKGPKMGGSKNDRRAMEDKAAGKKT